MITVEEHLASFRTRPCLPAVAWARALAAGGATPRDLYDRCRRGDWLLWGMEDAGVDAGALMAAARACAAAAVDLRLRAAGAALRDDIAARVRAIADAVLADPAGAEDALEPLWAEGRRHVAVWYCRRVLAEVVFCARRPVRREQCVAWGVPYEAYLLAPDNLGDAVGAATADAVRAHIPFETYLAAAEAAVLSRRGGDPPA